MVYVFALYTPSLAPIELVFANLKCRIAWIDTNEITNWNSNEGTKILKKSLNEIESNEIINCWTHSLNISENTLIVSSTIFWIKKVWDKYMEFHFNNVIM